MSVPDQEKLLKLLTKFEDLFDGTLGDWDIEPVSLKLKEGAKPYHGRPFPTPKAHKETLKKEVQRLCELGVLKWQPESEWALPSFIVPKQNQTVRFVSDFREVNKQIVRNPVFNTQNQYSFTGTGRVHVCNSPGPEHGLLYHQIGP